MSRFPLSRRTVLRGAGGAAVGLPWLEAMAPGSARAAEETAPRRIVFFFFANGVIPSQWTPTGSETSFTLSPVLMPLEPLKKKLVVLQGINMETARANPGNGHGVGISNLLVARKFLDETTTRAGSGFGWGSGVSIDQHIAGRINAGSKFPSLHFGAQAQDSYYRGEPYGYISYAGPKQPIAPEDDPLKMYQRIFTDVTGDTSAQAAALDRRRSVLDFVKESYRLLGTRLGATDRQRLTAHADGLRELERRLAMGGATAASCTKPGAPQAPQDLYSRENLGVVGKSMMDLLVSAFTCDITRVATLVWSGAQSGTVPPGVTAPDSNYHEVSHRTDAAALAALAAGETWYMRQLAYLAEAMDKIPGEGGGTLLDTTTIVTVSEIAVGNTHSYVNMPFALVGGCGGSIRTGRLLTFPGRPHNDLFVSLMNAMRIPETTFGDPAFCGGALPGLLA